jgi:hypothetical protein
MFSIKKRSDPRNHTKGTRNNTNKNLFFREGSGLLRVISWIVIIFQQPLKLCYFQPRGFQSESATPDEAANTLPGHF